MAPVSERSRFFSALALSFALHLATLHLATPTPATPSRSRLPAPESKAAIEVIRLGKTSVPATTVKTKHEPLSDQLLENPRENAAEDGPASNTVPDYGRQVYAFVSSLLRGHPWPQHGRLSHQEWTLELEVRSDGSLSIRNLDSAPSIYRKQLSELDMSHGPSAPPGLIEPDRPLVIRVPLRWATPSA